MITYGALQQNNLDVRSKSVNVAVGRSVLYIISAVEVKQIQPQIANADKKNFFCHWPLNVKTDQLNV